MRTKTRVDELEWDMAMAVGRISKLEWAFAEMFPKPKRKYVKSGLFTNEAKFAKQFGKRPQALNGLKDLPRKKHSRTWTDEQRMAHSKKLKAAWAARKQVS